MRKKIVLFQSCIFLLANICFGQNELKVGTISPKIEYQQSYPKSYKIPESKPIILDFWATWCGPCVAGLLETNEFIQKYTSKIEYIAITDSTSLNIESFIKRRKLHHNFIVDKTGKSFGNFGIDGIPYAYLIDSNHIIQWAGHGQQITTQLLDEFLKTGTVKTTTVVSIKKRL